jgi:hypothetical protein
MGLIVLFGIPALAFVGARWISKNLDWKKPKGFFLFWENTLVC